MIGTPRLVPLAARAALLAQLAVVGGCVTAGAGRPISTSTEAEAADERGPRVRIWTSDELGSGDRVRAAFRLDDDAYVTVVNVGLDGYASVIFPESPDDDGFMRGGRTYRLPSFFPGFANHFRNAHYRRLHNATSAYDGVYDRHAGYVFIIASWRPMHFQLADAAGLWDDVRLAVHERQLEPYVVMHHFASQLVPGRSRDYTARFARYAAIRGSPFGHAGSLASCALYGSALGRFPWWALQIGYWGTPAHAFGYDLAGSPCGRGYWIGRAAFRPVQRPGVTPPPVRPTPTPGDTATPTPKTPRPPRVAGDDDDEGARKPLRRGRRIAAAIEDDRIDEPVIDVTRETRELARRRDRGAERGDRASLRDGGYGESTTWDRVERARGRARVSAADEGDRGVERARHRASGDDTRASGRPSREASEPRREAPPRPEPRQEARPQQPPPRSAPAPRPEPRSERPAKPADPR